MGVVVNVPFPISFIIVMFDVTQYLTTEKNHPVNKANEEAIIRPFSIGHVPFHHINGRAFMKSYQRVFLFFLELFPSVLLPDR